ncbi:S-norcoclaurine synthase 1 [Vitis vinifera]|uniref:S-norcoclaurine synthase 1 n=1 Tax=Vitis vinifera TaxID=29760 RepID=A0A438DYT1_VITVI|nr:S-norcoclaurine synthase 1 [Vitis vinifera]
MLGEEMSRELGGSVLVANVQALASSYSGDVPLPLINHEVAEVIEKMKADVQEFFKLPQKKKNEYAKLPSGVDGYGQNFVVSEDQKLDWADMLFLQCLPASERNMRFWPDEPTSFRETLVKYSIGACKSFKLLLKLMAKNLEINLSSSQIYPGGLTLLVQLNEVQGLQIKKNGKWIPISPVPGAFIVNIGDVIEIMSNGEYKSIEHRAVVDPEKERLSIAIFCSPGAGAIIGPLQSLQRRKVQSINLHGL